MDGAREGESELGFELATRIGDFCGVRGGLGLSGGSAMSTIYLEGCWSDRVFVRRLRGPIESIFCKKSLTR